MRQGELIALRWQDVRFEAGAIDVRHSMHKGRLGPTKGGRSRQVQMSRRVREVLEPPRGGPSEFVFAQDGEPLTGNMIKNPMRRAREAVGRVELRFHDLRPSFASQLVAGGGSLQAVQQLLGSQCRCCCVR